MQFPPQNCLNNGNLMTSDDNDDNEDDSDGCVLLSLMMFIIEIGITFHFISYNIIL